MLQNISTEISTIFVLTACFKFINFVFQLFLYNSGRFDYVHILGGSGLQ
jgi:hypothetical protein